MTYSLYSACLTASIALSWASLTQAHLILKSPVPFGTDTLNNSPLVDAAIGSSGSDFPCKQRPGVYKISQMNNMAVGESQTLSFTGSASHGGGTCQLAVSLDHEPTTNSTWKLIQVYEGGCPITAAGNAGTDIFTYKIPEKFPNGQATLAWTWYNRVGNREIYMNCAPITVSGGADNQDYYNTLPDMYIINLPSSQCSSVESTNQIVPNPGQFVLKGDTADKLASATGPACGAAEAAQTNGVQGYQSAAQSNGAGPATGSAAAASTTAATVNNGQYTQASSAASPPVVATTANNGQYTAPAISVSAIPTAAPSGFTTLTSQSALSLAITVPAASTSPAMATTQSPQSSATAMLSTGVTSSAATPAVATGSGGHTPGTGSSGASGTAGGTTCTQNGAIICNGSSQFGICDNGHLIWQAVAAGTTCSNGVIQKRSWVGRKQQLGRWFAIDV